MTSTQRPHPAAAAFTVKPQLINPQATEGARRLMAYLCDIFGKRMLLGQQIGVLSTPEFEVLRETTGHYPAVGGFDMMNYSLSRVARGAQCQDTELAIDWWRAGGIVTFCWHWNAPQDLLDLPPDRGWGRGFYTEASTFNLAKALAEPDGTAYRLLLDDIDAIAVQLKKLGDAGVPVLWRPLHEANGGWFWWGAAGADACITLWKLMYERLTDHHGLHHLIWVWNGQQQDWYPGDAYVDIIGEDIYPESHVYGSQAERFRTAQRYSPTNKIIALTENGTLPDLDQMEADGAMWAWNCTWYGSFVAVRAEEGEEEQAGGRDVYSEQYTELSHLLHMYRHPLSITREQLPDLSTYPLPE